MAKQTKNLPVDLKWHDTKAQFGAAADNHEFVEGEYVPVAYGHQEYPKMMYHADFVAHPVAGQDLSFTQLPQIVHSKEEEEQLGDDWKPSPADHGIVTAPDREILEEKRKRMAAKSNNWRAAIPGANPDLTEDHLKFLQAQGVEVKAMGDVYAFLAGLTSAQMNSFMKEVADWLKKQKAKK